MELVPGVSDYFGCGFPDNITFGMPGAISASQGPDISGMTTMSPGVISKEHGSRSCSGVVVRSPRP